MPTTPHYGIVYPDGTSTLAPLQSWFQNVATSVDDALYSGLVNVVQVGNTAARDAYWGTPATGADRLALANKVPRWHNSDKGWEEQYYCATADGTTRYSRTTAGWYPAMDKGLIPIKPTSTSITGGSVAMDGATAVVSAVSAIRLNGIFSADFENYEVHFTGLASAAAATMGFRMSASGVDEAGAASYGNNQTDFTTSSTSVPNYAAASTGTMGRVSTLAGSNFRAIVGTPFSVGRTSVYGDGMATDGYRRVFGTTIGTSASYDGMLFTMNPTTFTGTIRVYGRNDY